MKLVLAILVAANLLVLGWGQGWLSPLLESPSARDREPYRESRQIRPESIRVGAWSATTGSPAAGASGAASANGAGVQSTPAEPEASSPRRR